MKKNLVKVIALTLAAMLAIAPLSAFAAPAADGEDDYGTVKKLTVNTQFAENVKELKIAPGKLVSFSVIAHYDDDETHKVTKKAKYQFVEGYFAQQTKNVYKARKGRAGKTDTCIISYQGKMKWIKLKIQKTKVKKVSISGKSSLHVKDTNKYRRSVEFDGKVSGSKEVVYSLSASNPLVKSNDFAKIVSEKDGKCELRGRKPGKITLYCYATDGSGKKGKKKITVKP